MAKILVLYYSSYGHILEMAEAVAEGARSALAQVDIRRVPELVPEEVARKSGYRLDQPHPIARVEDLPRYDAIVVGVGTRFGRMASQMANFLDQAGGLWASGALVGKVGSAFTSTATQHGGQETTLMAIHTNLLHFGMACVGLPYSFAGQTGSTRLPAEAPTAPRPSPAATARAALRPTSSTPPASRAATSPTSPPACSRRGRARRRATASCSPTSRGRSVTVT